MVSPLSTEQCCLEVSFFWFSLGSREDRAGKCTIAPMAPLLGGGPSSLHPPQWVAYLSLNNPVLLPTTTTTTTCTSSHLDWIPLVLGRSLSPPSFAKLCLSSEQIEKSRRQASRPYRRPGQAPVSCFLFSRMPTLTPPAIPISQPPPPPHYPAHACPFSSGAVSIVPDK